MTDRRYGTFKYGSGTLYGPSDLRDALAYGVEFDWDDDKMFDGSNEAAHMVGWSLFRGRRSPFKSNGSGYETIQTGTLNIVMDNADGRYNSMNTASPLYGQVVPGREVRFRVRDLATGTIYPQMVGTLSNPEPSGYGSKPRMNFKVEDGWRFLRSYEASVNLQQSVTPDSAVSQILDNVGWPDRWGTNLDVLADTIPYWWASGKNKAGSEIEDVVNSFLSYFFIDNEGKARLISRTNVSSSVCDYYEEQLLKDIGNPQPWENQFNVTKVTIHPRNAASVGTIYQLLGNVPPVQPGAANKLVMFLNYSYNNVQGPAKNVITPVATTDYLMNSQANGLGTNKTANCSVVFTDLGSRGLIEITNNDASTVYITLLKVRGEAIYAVDSADVTYPTDLSTVSQKHQFTLDLNWQQDINNAISFAGVLGPWLSTNHPFPIIRIDNRPALQYGVDLFDVVTLDSPYLGIGGNAFRIGGIQHKTVGPENCQRVLTDLYLEPYIAADDFWTWDTSSDFGVTTIFGY